MASSGGERRLVFDTGGKRKHVVRVVYAILALLMGGSLFLVIGPVNLGELFSQSDSATSASKALDEQAERIEKRLVKSPNDEQLLLALTRARINGGNAQIAVVSETEIPTVSAEAREDFDAGSQAWNRYLKQAGDEPSATLAQLVAGTFFRLAESSTSVLEAEEHIAKAAEAQQVAAEERPNINSLSTLAIYRYFNGEFAVADKAAKRAAAEASSKAESKSVEEQLAEYRKRGKKFDEQRKQLAKVQNQFNKEQLQNPLGLGAPLGE